MSGQGYWALKSIVDNNRRQAAAYNALPPDACPFDGSPLQIGKDSVRNCPMGDYRWTGGDRLA